MILFTIIYLLLLKLGRYGIVGKNFLWIKDFLRNRHQMVKINGHSSNVSLIESGVPQGGVLSGLMFILYINDLPKCLNYMKCSLYADDAKLYGPIINADSQAHIQYDLNEVVKWCNRWRLRLNVQKCFYLHYRPQKCNNIFPTYDMDGVPLPRRTTATDLGITISDDLKFHEQVAAACKKANREIAIIRRTFVSRNPKFLANLYKMHVRTRLEHCVQVWNPVYTGDTIAMEKVQNRFTRLLRHGRVMAPEERNVFLGITDHKTRRLRGDLVHIYKMLEDENLFSLLAEGRTRGNSKKISQERANNNIRQHSFVIRNVPVWNNLPENIVNTPTLNSFKSRLDQYLS